MNLYPTEPVHQHFHHPICHYDQVPTLELKGFTSATLFRTLNLIPQNVCMQVSHMSEPLNTHETVSKLETRSKILGPRYWALAFNLLRADIVIASTWQCSGNISRSNSKAAVGAVNITPMIVRSATCLREGGVRMKNKSGWTKNLVFVFGVAEKSIY